MNTCVYVLAFDSTHAALAADKAFKNTGALLIPTPRAISAGCGMSLKFSAETDDEALARSTAVPDACGCAALYSAHDQEFKLLAKV